MLCWPKGTSQILMITNQVYWLLIINIKMSDMLELIMHQIKIFQAFKMTIVYLIEFLEDN